MAADILDYLQLDGGNDLWDSPDGTDPSISPGGSPYYPAMANCATVSLTHSTATHLPPYITAYYIERFE